MYQKRKRGLIIHMSIMFAYARCSTRESQGLQDINRQIRELEKLGVEKENIFSEYESGMKEERTQLKKLLDTVQSGDSIYCTEASRITRSIKQLISILEFAREKQIKLVLGSFVVDFTDEVDPMTLAVVQLMGVFSELERNIIRERVLSGLDNAKSKGITLGRPRLTEEDIPDKFYKYLNLYNKKEINKVEFAKVMGWSRSRLDRYLKIRRFI